MAASVHQLDTARDPAARLREAGWESQQRLGKTIWQHPRTGCWYSLEMALQIAQREGNGEEK